MSDQKDTFSSNPKEVTESFSGKKESEPHFPKTALPKFFNQFFGAKVQIKVGRNEELGTLLQASVDLCEKGLDGKSAACQIFLNKGLNKAFTTILINDDVCNWPTQTQIDVNHHCQTLMKLCAVKLNSDSNQFLDLLAVLLDPNNAFHQFNSTDSPKSVQSISLESNDGDKNEKKMQFYLFKKQGDEIYAMPVDVLMRPFGYLVDLINLFGDLGGFTDLLHVFVNGKNLGVAKVWALMKPFYLCRKFLTVDTIVTYFIPIVDILLGNLLTEDLINSQNYKNPVELLNIIRACILFESRTPERKNTLVKLQRLRFNTIFRWFRMSSLDCKIACLKELNQIVTEISDKVCGKNGDSDQEKKVKRKEISLSFATSTVLEWIKKNEITEIVLSDLLLKCDVDEIKQFLQFVMKHKALTLKHLNTMWAARNSENKLNIHNLLAKLTDDFTQEHHDHLLECVEFEWTNNTDDRERLLELVTELYKNINARSGQILELIWSWAHSDNATIQIIFLAFKKHINILAANSSQDGEITNGLRKYWLRKCVEDLNNQKFVLSALKQIIRICHLYEASPKTNKENDVVYRESVIQELQEDHMLLNIVCNSLNSYMDEARKLLNNTELTSTTLYVIDGYCHVVQIKERLNFFSYFLKAGCFLLSYRCATTLWKCLVENAIFPSDRECAFRWFSQLLNEESHLHPSTVKDFFQSVIHKMDAALLTDSGLECVRRFVYVVNKIESSGSKITTVFSNQELTGMDLYFRIIRDSNEEVARKALDSILQVQAKVGTNASESVGKLLECPVCFLTIDLPVKTCSRGHAVCSKCIKGLKNCPICRENFLRNNPTMLNQLLEITPISCRNINNGCKQKLLLGKIADHERNCDYRFVTCFCSKKDLVFCKFDEHLKKNSNHLVTSVDFSSWHCLSIDYSKKDHEHRIYFVAEIQTHFLFRCFINRQNYTAYFTVNCIGKSENAVRYMYEIRVDQGQGNFESNTYYFTLNGRCLPYIENVAEIQRHSNAVSFEIRKILFDKLNPMKFEVEIRIRPRAVPVKKQEFNIH